ncbi:NAD(P)/FAD-dependent oxidoreductase [Planctomycetaceae bacterium SH139]
MAFSFSRPAGDRQFANGLVALSRGRMDQALLALAQHRGVEILQPATARIVAATDQGVEVETVPAGFGAGASGATRWRCRAVVFASGLAGGDQQQWLPWKSAPSGPIGVGANFAYGGEAYQPGVIYMGCADGGYAGVVRLENGGLDVAAAIYEPAGRQKNIPLGERIENIIELSGLPPVAAPAGTHWKGTPRLQRQRIPGRQRILAIGDAAGYVEPFTGEGMAWAMETGRLAAEAIVDSLPTGGNAGDRYAAAYQRRLTRRKLTCRLLSAALRRPRARATLFTTLAHCPWLARPVIGLLNRRF